MQVLLIGTENALTCRAAQMLRGPAIHVTRCAPPEAAALSSRDDVELIVLAMTAREQDGLDILKLLREKGSGPPLAVISGIVPLHVKVRALDLGADAYLVYPFHRDELIAELRALLRRSCGHVQSVIVSGQVAVNLATRTAAVNGRVLPLTHKEYQVLELLALRRGATISRSVLVNHLYGGDEGPQSRTVEIFISKLRKKLAAATGGDRCIRTIASRGYLLAPILAA